MAAMVAYQGRPVHDVRFVQLSSRIQCDKVRVIRSISASTNEAAHTKNKMEKSWITIGIVSGVAPSLRYCAIPAKIKLDVYEWST